MYHISGLFLFNSQLKIQSVEIAESYTIKYKNFALFFQVITSFQKNYLGSKFGDPSLSTIHLKPKSERELSSLRKRLVPGCNQ